MEPSAPPRRGTFDLPKPEAGLAEWMTKIKALQRQVDADEEAEQRRLEEEIAAARRARLRRSRGAGYGGDSMDFSISPNSIKITPCKSPSTEMFTAPLDRSNGQDDAPRKQTGATSSSNIDTSSITHGILPKSSHFLATQPPPSQRPEPISLATFIGGRATGPRLNRHAPQQNVHDSTQFEQRTINAPHPVFGKGGVAMPGMVTKANNSVHQPRLIKRTSVPSFTNQEEESLPQPISLRKSGQRDRTISTSSAAKYLQQSQPRPTSPQKSGFRERTLSTPVSSTPKPSENVTVSSRLETGTSKVGHRPASWTKDRLSTPSQPMTSSRGMPERPTTPREPLSSVIAPVSPHKSSITTPSLARAISPAPRSSLQVPFIPNNTVPSPAFQKSPPPKDFTPSISRLQGRGFVQNMVRASIQLENASKSFSSPPASRPSSARKSSVLDRWQTNITPSSPTPPTISCPTTPPRKAYSEASARFETRQSHIPTLVSTTPPPLPSKTLKLKASHPHLHPDLLSPQEPLSPRRAKLAEQMLPPEGGPSFGSATTMVVYKPKTPEPLVANPPSVVDELGVKRDHDSSSDGNGRPRSLVPSELPGPSGKPLNHPTKDRARKPKKNNGVSTSKAELTQPARGLGPTSETIFSFSRVSHLSPTLPSKYEDDPSPQSSSFTPHNILSITTRSTEKEPAAQIVHTTQNWGVSVPTGVKRVDTSFQSKVQGFQPETRLKPVPNLMRSALPGITESDSLHTPLSVFPLSKSTLRTVNDSVQRSSSNLSPPYPPGDTGSPVSIENQTRSSSAFMNGRVPKPPSPAHISISSARNRAHAMDITPASNGDNADAASRNSQFKEEAMSLGARLAPGTSLEEAASDRTPVGMITRTLDTGLPKPGIRADKMGQGKIHLEFDDGPLPSIDISQLLQPQQTLPISFSDSETISVDVFSVDGSSCDAITHDTDVFYDSELLAIVHRYTSTLSGSALTRSWVWRGKKCIFGEKEERKVQEFAKRYDTKPEIIHQNSEPITLVRLLGGSLIIRQGTRLRWSANDTAMYSIRSLKGVEFIDEHNLSVRNLCSAFSYCLTISDMMYLWHGCGSTDVERQAAIKYAARICNQRANIIEMFEAKNDQVEAFWMALGDEEFANADYWQWRRNAPDVDPRIWRVNARTYPTVVAVASLQEESMPERSIYIIDCIWELFVQVGAAARGDRVNIKAAFYAAKRFSEASASSRPFAPPVHVLVLPSKLPLDLRLNLRGLDDSEVNYGQVPDHMNLLSSVQAESHLRQHAWERLALQDETMLPLGVSALDTQ